MRSWSIRAAASAVALLLVPLGVVAAGPVGQAAAQSLVSTQGYTIGSGPVSDATAVAQPNTAGATADYTIGFTTPLALAKGTGTITLTDPQASTTFPAAQADYIVIDNTSTAGNQAAASATLGKGGHSVTLALSKAVAAGDSLSVYVVGATNPTGPGSYSLNVSTSANPQPASTAGYQILAAASPPAFAPAAAPPIAGAASTYTIGAFKASSPVATGGSIEIASSGGSGMTDNVAFPTAASSYKVDDLTTGKSSTPQAASVGGVGSGNTGESVSLELTSPVAAGDELSVVVSGVHNPSTTQKDTIAAAAPGSASASSADVQIGTSVAGPTISLSQATASVTGVEYTVGFKASSDLAAGGTVTIVAPAGTSFAGAEVTLVDLTHAGASANIASSAAKASAAASSPSDNQLEFTVPKGVSAGDGLLVEVQGATNPPAGTYGGTAGDFTVATAADVIPAIIPSYVVTAAPAPVLASIELSSTTPGAGAQYTIGDLKTTAALLAGQSTIEVKAPAGTVFPKQVGDFVISDLTNSVSAHPSAVPGGGTNDVVLSVGANIASGDFIEIIAGNVLNPSPGTYSVSLAGDIVASVAPAPPKATAIAVTSSSNPVVSGRSVTYVARLTPALNTGSITFTTNGAVISGCSDVPVHTGEAVCSATYGASGQQLVKAEYLGSAGYASSSATLAETVATPAAPPKSVAISISATPNPVLVGRPVTYIVRIAPGLSAGSVMFMSDGTSVGDCSAVPVNAGQATCTVTYGSGGSHQVTGEYLGSPGYTSSMTGLYSESVMASTSTSIFAAVNPASVGQSVTFVARVTPAASVGAVSFSQNGVVLPGCGAVRVAAGRASCTVTYWRGGRRMVQATYSGPSGVLTSTSTLYREAVSFPATGYWLATRTGVVYGEGGAASLGGISTSASTGPVVGIAGTPNGEGYWVVTSHGTVAAFGDARSYGDLASLKINVSDIVAIAPSHDGRGYWLIGRDGGMFTFGDAKFHGSVPGLHLHVTDIVGMVASAQGGGYLLAGADGGVFSFGSAHFYGSLPGLHKHVKDIRAILPSSSGTGYVLVGSDGGAFVFGTGVRFLGSLPGRGLELNDVVGIALTPDNAGYFMAAANGPVYGFGNAKPLPVPAGINTANPVVAIAGT
jgi:hypothetical protein